MIATTTDGGIMKGVDVQEVSLEEYHQVTMAHERVKMHIAAGIEHFDEEFGPGAVLNKPELLAAFVNAAALESLAGAIVTARVPLFPASH